MNESLEEIIKNKRSLSQGGRHGGQKQIGSKSFGGGKRGGGGPMRRGRSTAMRSNRLTPYSKGNNNAPWAHDMYQGPKRQKIRSGFLTTNIQKIVISNLYYGVTSTDIQEVFEEFGKLKTATVHYNRSGTSLGTADVVFKNKNAALKAIRQYNNVPLDGRPMKIKLATDLSVIANLAARLSRPLPVRYFRGGVKVKRIKRGNFHGKSKRRGGGGNGNKGARKSVKKKLTKDELDRQLDSYIKSNNN